MTCFVNLTPHPIVIYATNGRDVLREIPPSGQCARLVDPHSPGRHAAPIDGIPAAVPTPLESRQLVGLPAPEAGTVYVTSILCLAAARSQGRLDVVAPDTDGGVVRDAQGRILGTTRLLLAGDEPPTYRVLSGSATHENWRSAADTDVFGYGAVNGDDPAAPVGPYVRCGQVWAYAGTDSPPPVDYHEIVPELRGGEWVIPVPVWGPDDPSRPELLWHSPTARPVRVVRDVQTIGPAQLRRWAATGIEPAWPDGRDTRNFHPWVVEISDEPGTGNYRGCGLSAYRAAFAKVEAAGLLDRLPAHLQELAATLRTAPDSTLSRIRDYARLWARLPSPPDTAPAQVRQDVTGSPGAARAVILEWDPVRAAWCSAYAGCAGHGERPRSRSFHDVIADWASAIAEAI